MRCVLGRHDTPGSEHLGLKHAKYLIDNVLFWVYWVQIRSNECQPFFLQLSEMWLLNAVGLHLFLSGSAGPDPLPGS